MEPRRYLTDHLHTPTLDRFVGVNRFMMLILSHTISGRCVISIYLSDSF